MKKIYLLLGLFVLFFVNTSFSGEIPVTKAQKVALNYYNHWSHYRTPAKIIETIPVTENNTLVYFVFNFSTGGYMIVSADDDVTPVLSYSFKGHFIQDDSNMPPDYKYLLENYQKQILEVKTRHLKGEKSVKDKWTNYSNNSFTATRQIQDVSPLLDIEGITWDQGCYYNADCPADGSGPCGHVYTGCVATAMAQIMRFHKWPDHGTGSHSYNAGTYGTLSADYGSSIYDWNSMPPSVTSSNAEVAKVISHCGIAVDMSYSASGSGAYVYGYVKEGFVNYFNYDAGAMYAYRANYTDVNWKNLMCSDLDSGWPIFYSGTDQAGSAGHAFVCDGYQGTDNFHFNWGWSGGYNSYNTIDNMVPGGNDFSYNQEAVFHVHPTYGLTSVFSGTPTSLYVGNSVVFTDGSYGSPTSWSWAFGDAGTATSQNPVHTYNAAGLFNVSLTVGDGSTTDSQTKTQYVKVVPTDAGFSMDFEDCVDYSNDFFPWSVVDGDNINTYGSSDCDFPGESSLMSFIAFNPTDAGFALASAHGGQRVGMSICPGDASQSDDWLISEHLQLGTSSSISLWSLSPKPGTWGNDSYQVLVSTSGNSPSDFTVISGPTAVEAPAAWAQQSYDLSAYDGQNIYIAIHHVSTDMFMFWVDDIQINTSGGSTSLTADFIADNTSVAVGGTVNFTDNSTGTPTSWSWTFGDGGTSVTQNPSNTYNTAGVYTVELTVSDGTNSDVETKTSYITVSNGPIGNWIEEVSGFTTASRGIDDISIVDANIVWAKAYDGSGGTANVQEFTKTTNGGTTWTPGNINIGNTTLGISMLTATSTNTAWVAAYDGAGGGNGGIWKTTDGGSIWTKQTTADYTDAGSFPNVVCFWDVNTGFCQGDPVSGKFQLYTTTNGGTTWTVVPGANIPAPLSGEYGYTGQVEVVGDNVWFSTNKGRIYYSSDKGHNFVVYQTPLSDFGGQTESGNFSFKDANNGLIVDNNATVYKTTNGGANWTPVTTAGTVFTSGLCWVEGTDLVFSTGAASGASGSSYSEDGGTVWTNIDNQQHLYVEFMDSQTGWSGWFNTDATTGGMWKWNSTTTDNPVVETVDNQLIVYPNPMSDNLNLRFLNVPQKVEISLTNLLGKLVYSKTINQPVSNKISLDLGFLAKGLYILTINNDATIVQTKVVKQ
ncbi:MAG: C10 family peptidase [Bacteroidales bacterium]|nr:C10 family peptidase [Bacteroidales bacterium]